MTKSLSEWYKLKGEKEIHEGCASKLVCEGSTTNEYEGGREKNEI